jgi:hypothetical protein
LAMTAIVPRPIGPHVNVEIPGAKSAERSQ